MNQGSQPAYRLCFSGSPSCSGAVPCKACLFRIEERTLPGAMMVDGQLLQDLYVALTTLQQFGVHPASLGIVVRTPVEQADAFVQGYYAGLQRLHQDMLGELRGLVMATPVASVPALAQQRSQNVPMTAAAAYAQSDPWGGDVHIPPVHSPLHGSLSASPQVSPLFSQNAAPLTGQGTWASGPLPASPLSAGPQVRQSGGPLDERLPDLSGGLSDLRTSGHAETEAARKAAHEAVMAAATIENARLKAQAEAELAQRLEVRKRRAAQEIESARLAEVEKQRIEALTRPMDEEEILASAESVDDEDDPSHTLNANGVVTPTSSSSSSAS